MPTEYDTARNVAITWLVCQPVITPVVIATAVEKMLLIYPDINASQLKAELLTEYS